MIYIYTHTYIYTNALYLHLPNIYIYDPILSVLLMVSSILCHTVRYSHHFPFGSICTNIWHFFSKLYTHTYPHHVAIYHYIPIIPPLYPHYYKCFAMIQPFYDILLLGYIYHNIFQWQLSQLLPTFLMIYAHMYIPRRLPMISPFAISWSSSNMLQLLASSIPIISQLLPLIWEEYNLIP